MAIKSLTISNVTVSGNTVTGMHLGVNTAFTGNLTKSNISLFTFNSTTGAWDNQDSNLTFTADTGTGDEAKLGGTVSFTSALNNTSTLRIQISDGTDTTGYLIQDLLTIFDSSGNVAEAISYQLPVDRGTYNVSLESVNEQTVSTKNIQSADFPLNELINSATITVSNSDYVSMLAGDIVEVTIANALDESSAAFTGNYRLVFKSDKVS